MLKNSLYKLYKIKFKQALIFLTNFNNYKSTHFNTKMAIQTLFIGRKLIHLKEVDSTNSFTLEMLKNNSLEEGTVVIADNQTQGRGQRGNSWKSAQGENITLSLVLLPKIKISEQFYITKAISLAVADFISNELKTESVKIKWPNDIYVNDAKIAGILIENSFSDNIINSSVVGIGININQVDFSNLNTKVTSLKKLTTTHYNIAELLNKLYSYLEAYYLHLKLDKKQKLDDSYSPQLYLLNTFSEFIVRGERRIAKITGVDAQGKIYLTTEQGISFSCTLHELTFIHTA